MEQSVVILEFLLKTLFKVSTTFVLSPTEETTMADFFFKLSFPYTSYVSTRVIQKKKEWKGNMACLLVTATVLSQRDPLSTDAYTV